MRKKDYHQPSHPSLFNRRVVIEKEKKSFKKMILFFIILILIILIIYFLFFSSFFQIKKIIIAGTNQAEEIISIEKIVREFISHKRFYILSQKNIFILSQSGLKNIINNNFDLANVVLITNLPNALKIQIKHKVPALIWQEDNNYFTIYNDGVIKNEIDDIQKFELPIVNQGTSTEVVIGQKVVSGEQIDYIQKLFSLFNFYFKDFQVKQFVVTSLKSREVKLITNEKWYILFNLDIEPQDSLEIVKAVLSQKIPDRANLQYIDARIKDKIYYK